MNTYENTMWGYVLTMGWGRPTFDYNAISNAIHTKWDKELIAKIYDFCTDKVNDLYKAIHQYERDNRLQLNHGLGDDGLDDLIWHIVGCGQETYKDTFKHPCLILQHAKNEFKESFGYCFKTPENKPVSIPVTHSTCWCCGASSEPPTQEEMLRDFGHYLTNLKEKGLINFAMMILNDLPEEILESYYVKNIIKKVD